MRPDGQKKCGGQSKFHREEKFVVFWTGTVHSSVRCPLSENGDDDEVMGRRGNVDQTDGWSTLVIHHFQFQSLHRGKEKKKKNGDQIFGDLVTEGRKETAELIHCYCYAED